MNFLLVLGLSTEIAWAVLPGIGPVAPLFDEVEKVMDLTVEQQFQELEGFLWRADSFLVRLEPLCGEGPIKEEFESARMTLRAYGEARSDLVRTWHSNGDSARLDANLMSLRFSAKEFYFSLWAPPRSGERLRYPRLQLANRGITDVQGQEKLMVREAEWPIERFLESNGLFEYRYPLIHEYVESLNDLADLATLGGDRSSNYRIITMVRAELVQAFCSLPNSMTPAEVLRRLKGIEIEMKAADAPSVERLLLWAFALEAKIEFGPEKLKSVREAQGALRKAITWQIERVRTHQVRNILSTLKARVADLQFGAQGRPSKDPCDLALTRIRRLVNISRE